MSDSQQTERSIFLEAIEKDSEEERAAFIIASCGDNEQLRAEVTALLRAHKQSGDLLDAPDRADPTTGETGGESPGTVIGPYKLLQKVGEGGMGVVYMAQQTEPVERRVALKIIKPGMDTRQVIGRFEAERQALAMMDHPNIAKVFDAGATDAGRPYFAMELVKGVPVTQYCDEKHLNVRERLALFVPICQAVQHAHQKGIIHRDIKPTNVLVAEYDDRAVPKVIDFGVAKATQQRLTEKTMFTEFGQVVGTIDYMSPEQAKLNQLDIDTRTDVYSLGVLLYELLTGLTPFDRERLRSAALDELLRIIREEEPPRPSLRLSSSESLPLIAANRHVEPRRLSLLVRGELDWIVMKALEKDRTGRYETANLLVRDVEHYLHDEPIEACPPSAGYRLRRFVRKHRAAVTGAVAMIILLTATLAAVTWSLFESRRQRDVALAERNRADGEAAVAEAVNDFLQDDLLGRVDPSNQQGGSAVYDPDVTLRTLLDRASHSIEGKFSDQPTVEAAIRKTVGEAQFALWDYEAGTRHLNRAVQLQTEALGPSHLDTLESKRSLAAMYMHNSHLQRAERLFRDVHDARTLQLGAMHKDTLESERDLARVAFVDGFANGEGPVRAEKLYTKVLEAQMATLGEEHDETLKTKQELAEVYVYRRQFDLACEIYVDVIDALSTRYGASHPDVLSAKLRLVGIYRIERRFSDAEALVEEVIRERTDQLGPRHSDTLSSRLTLVWLRMRQRRFDEAEALANDVLQICQSNLAPGNSLTLWALSALAIAKQTQDDFKAAEAYWRQIVDQQRNVDTEGAMFASSLERLGMNLSFQKRFDEAESTLREALAIRKKQSPDSYQIFQAELAQTLIDQKRFEEAEPLILGAYEAAKRTENSVVFEGPGLAYDMRQRLLDVLGSLVQLYEGWDKSEEADRWNKELAAVEQAHRGKTGSSDSM